MADNNVGSIYYTVEADTAGVINSTRTFDKELDELDKTVKRVDGSTGKLDKSNKALSTTISKSAREANKATSNFSSLHKVLGSLLTVQGIGSVIGMAESYNEMAERVKMATRSQVEFERVQSRLLDTANGTYRALSEAQEVYIRTSDSLRSLGYSTDQVLDITDSLSYAFVKNAASTYRAENALNAYSKAVNKGRVDVDMWESIISATPSIINDIAEAAGKSAQEIRAMGSSGKLTAQMLNEGLRQSLESNRTAAENMRTTVRDAFQQFRNSLSAYLGESQKVMGSADLMAKAIATLGSNIDTLVNAFLALGAGAIAKYVAATGASLIATAKAGLAARALAVEELNLARAHEAATAAKLRAVQANVMISRTGSVATAAVAAQTAAVGRLAAAQTALAGVGSTLLRLVGGPVGLIASVAMVASGFLLMRKSSQDAAEGVKAATRSIEELIAARKNLREGGTIVSEEEAEAIKEQEAEIKRMENAILQLVAARQRLADSGNAAGADSINTEIKKISDSVEKARAKISELREEIQQTVSPIKEEKIELTEAQKRLEAMRQELALARLVGDEREKLQAIQRLGSEATEDEKREAAALAIEILRTEEALKKAAEAHKASVEAAEENIKVITDLAVQYSMAALSGEELAAAQARMKLNPSATPQEVEYVEALARALWDAEEAARKRADIGDDVDKFVRGDVEPLRGGPFDDQLARFKQEEELERERYTAQLERMKQAKDLQLETTQTYLELEERLLREHNERLAQIEEAKNYAILESSKQAFGSLADIIGEAAGKSSGAFKALFAIQKGFAIAQATLQLNSAIMQAFADPSAMTPQQKMANAAAVAGAAGSFVSAIASASYGGGRRNGGPVEAGKFYRVNEGGTPEMLSVKGNDWLMMGSQRGKVTPLKGSPAGSGAGSTVNVNVVINSDSVDTSSTVGYEAFAKDIGAVIDGKFAELAAKSARPGGSLWNKMNGRG